MRDEQASLLIGFDEDEQKLRFYAVTGTGSEASPLTPRQLPHLELELSKLKPKGPDETERVVGASVLVFFEFHSRTTLGIRDYQALGKQFAATFVDDTKHAAARNDAEAQYELAMHHLDLSIKNRSRPDLDLAQKWLQTSADGSCEAAKDYLRDHWPRMKAYAERRIGDAE
jgi:hypothetical protein